MAEPSDQNCSTEGREQQLEARIAELEAKLEESEEHTRAILNTAVDGIITIDEHGLIEQFNKAAEQIFGYRAEEVIGENVKILMPSPYREEHDGYIERYLRTGEARIIGIGREVEGQRKDGSVFPMELGVGEMNFGGETKFTGFVHDISDRRELEERVRRSERMEALGQLAGGIAHDFNNVLTIVNSYTYTSMAHDDLAPELEHYLSKIKDAAERGARLTRQLLAFSPEQIGEPRVLDLNEVIREIKGLARSIIEEDIEFEVRLESDLPRVEVDPGQIEQVIMNLIVNARDAMPRGGRLNIRTHKAYLSPALRRSGYHPELSPGDYVLLIVEDTGVGMDEETRSHIFEPFFTTKPTGKGTGLGLATVYGIVQRYGGQICVESEPGEGSAFYIYFPLAESEAATWVTERVAQTRRESSGGETILLVEDEEDVREPLKLALEGRGYSVIEAKSGKNAIDVIDAYEGQIDLVLTDVIMPELSGVELVDHLAKEYPSMQSILVSGYSGEVLQRKEISPQRVRVAKPYDIDELASLVRDMLDEGRAS
ncbi:PAS domain S-box protein [Persicimonas caeni]|uniref:Sensor protein FixL n=1 Tax=Persicimonas caeni TaxID=2292766 RepID=A0A4Y6PVR6_PERCE|nr:PAS domain S-box protein [Persicimonas caeni]QDG52340.1 PAS domain S-box protein [Persicimonas caeni]QED33562.1 PAS domain S-box protein [Persicimonas caeni]